MIIDGNTTESVVGADDTDHVTSVMMPKLAILYEFMMMTSTVLMLIMRILLMIIATDGVGADDTDHVTSVLMPKLTTLY